MTIGNEREQLLFAEWESLGEDEIRLRINSNAYSIVDRELMKIWLDIKESKRTLDLHKKTAWILRLTVAIVILTLILVIFSLLPYISIETQPKSYTNAPQKYQDKPMINEETKQPLVLKPSGKATK